MNTTISRKYVITEPSGAFLALHDEPTYHLDEAVLYDCQPVLMKGDKRQVIPVLVCTCGGMSLDTDRKFILRHRTPPTAPGYYWYSDEQSFNSGFRPAMLLEVDTHPDMTDSSRLYVIDHKGNAEPLADFEGGVWSDPVGHPEVMLP